MPHESGRLSVPKTATSPPTDARLWRLLLARCHPDAGGNEEVFVFAQGVREAVASCAPAARQLCERCPSTPTGARPAEDTARIPFDPDLRDPVTLTCRAISLAEEVAHPYSAALRLLANCSPAAHGRLQLAERRGATYRQLAAIAHAVGMSYPERLEWYTVAESVPLSQRHAGHILSRIKERAA